MTGRPASSAQSSSSAGIGPPPSRIPRRFGARSSPASRRRRSIVGTSEAIVTSPASINAFTVFGSNGSATTVAPKIAQRVKIDSPAMWWTGRQQSQRSSGSTGEHGGAGVGARLEVRTGEADRPRLAGGTPT